MTRLLFQKVFKHLGHQSATWSVYLLCMCTESNQESKPSIIRSHWKGSLKLQWGIIATWKTNYSFNLPLLCCIHGYSFPIMHNMPQKRHKLLSREESDGADGYICQPTCFHRELQDFLVFSIQAEFFLKNVRFVHPSLPKVLTHAGITERHVWLGHLSCSCENLSETPQLSVCHRLWISASAIFTCWVSRSFFFFVSRRLKSSEVFGNARANWQTAVS